MSRNTSKPGRASRCLWGCGYTGNPLMATEHSAIVPKKYGDETVLLCRDCQNREQSDGEKDHSLRADTGNPKMEKIGPTMVARGRLPQDDRQTPWPNYGAMASWTRPRWCFLMRPEASHRALPSPPKYYVPAPTTDEARRDATVGAKAIGNREDRVPTLVLRSHWSLGGIHRSRRKSILASAEDQKKEPQAEAGFAIRHGSPGSGGASVLRGRPAHTYTAHDLKSIYRSSGAVSLEHGGQVRERELRRPLA